ncbi:MAG: YidC/Oxa1 family membrane protein insertase [Actinomycetia bacterium]|nr:YidC/Oxa1 family membrane protein insertase [Actinomycetes bacterium]
MFAFIEGIMFDVLKYFYAWAHDYGVAIILLTVVVRVVLLPLTLKQSKSMYELQRIQPKIKELQAKYKNDKQKLQEETLKFYQENKVNPFGGCLPMIIQMPIFIALYRVLGGTPEKPGLFLQHISELGAAQAEAARRFWIILPDLTRTPSAIFSDQGIIGAIPYVVLVVLFGLSIYIPQLMQPGEKQQRQMALYMSIVMLIFGWSAPAGVLLYWVTSSVLQIAQQFITNKVYSRGEGAK